MLLNEMSTQGVVRTVQALGVLLDSIYFIYVLTIVLNLIQMWALTKKNIFFFVSLFKSRGSVLSLDILHVQIFIKQKGGNSFFGKNYQKCWWCLATK